MDALSEYCRLGIGTRLFLTPKTLQWHKGLRIEQIGKALLAKGFCSRVFALLKKVVDRLCETVNHLAKETMISIPRLDCTGNAPIAE